MNTLKCARCQEVKPESKFQFKRTENRFNSWCRDCMNKTDYERMLARKTKAIRLMGGKCCRCGYDKNYHVLQFHHVDPKQKDSAWAGMRRWPWGKVVEELKKCVLLCANCHADLHYPDQRNELTVSADANLLCGLHSTGRCLQCGKDVYETDYCSVGCAKEDGYRRRKHRDNSGCHGADPLWRSKPKYNSRKVKERPDLQTLEKMVEEHGFCSVGRQFGVSDNAVRKWIKSAKEAEGLDSGDFCPII